MQVKWEALPLASHGYEQEKPSKEGDEQCKPEDRKIMEAITQVEHATTFTSG